MKHAAKEIKIRGTVAPEASARFTEAESEALFFAVEADHHGAPMELDLLLAKDTTDEPHVCGSGAFSEDRARLLDCAWKQNDAIGAFCLVLVHTGCRISEALALRWMDIEAARGTLVIKSLQQRGVTRIRHVPAPPTLIKRLLELRTAGSPSFDERIWTWSRVTAWRRMRDIFGKAKIGGPLATPQGFRASFARTALNGGVPKEIVCRWLGVSHLKVDCTHDQHGSADDNPWKEILWREPDTPRRDSSSLWSPVDLAST